MAQTTTLAQLTTRCATRFDDPSQTYITEWPDLINEALAALHNELVSTDEGYVQKETTLTLVQGQVKYTLPADFFKDTAVFLVSSGNYLPLNRFMRKEYRGGLATLPANIWAASIRYDIVGDPTGGTKIWFDPTPSGTTPNTIAIWYVPHFAALVNQSDVLPAWLPPGWEEFLVNYAVTRARVREQSASGEDMNILLEQMKERIAKESINRDMMNTKRVVDRSGFGTAGWGGYDWPY